MNTKHIPTPPSAHRLHFQELAMQTALAAALLVAAGAHGEPGSQPGSQPGSHPSPPSNSQPDSNPNAQPGPEELVNALNGVFGAHAGKRASHAKGFCATGEFLPSAQAH